MKNYLIRIITLIVCLMAIGTTYCMADVAPMDFPSNRMTRNKVENNTTSINWTSNQSNEKEKNESSSDIEFPKLMIIIFGTIAVISAMSIVILAFISKREGEK